jgi:tetratricopeptide (TPR) repeat protein
VAVLAQDGQLAQALDRLREVAPSARVGPGPLRQLAAETELDLLLKLAEQEVASAAVAELQQGIRHGHEALVLADSLGQRDEVATRLRDLAMGRARVLAENSRLNEAIQLLEGAADWCDDGELQGALAELLAARGIITANRGHLPEAVQDLRRAHACNPHSAHALHDLSLVLAHHADEVCLQDAQQASRLADEAFELAEKCHQADHDNSSLKQTRDELARKRDAYRQRLAGTLDARPIVANILGDLLE